MFPPPFHRRRLWATRGRPRVTSPGLMSLLPRGNLHLPLLLLPVLLLLALGLVAVPAGGVASALFSGRQRDKIRTGILIPGFASSRLHAWAHYDCPLTPLDFWPLDPVWIDMQKVVGAPRCWLRCISLQARNQSDHPECKARVEHGLSAITELSPGLFTGPLSSVWRAWVNWMAEFEVDYEAVVALPYDWRLFPRKLEERDLFFHRMRITFEAARKLRGPAVVFAHSLGNNVFRYFLEWLRHHVAPRAYQRWINRHIHAYYAIAAAHLGTPEALRGMLSGITFGLPIPVGMARAMGNTFGSSLWMHPFSPHCRASQPRPWDSYSGAHSHWPPPGPRYSCSPSSRNFSGWPLPVVSIRGRDRQGPGKGAAAAAGPRECAADDSFQPLGSCVAPPGSTSLPGQGGERGAAVQGPQSPEAGDCPGQAGEAHAEAAQSRASGAKSTGSPPEPRGSSGSPDSPGVSGSNLPGSRGGERSYSAQEVADGTFLRDIAGLDPDAAVFAEKLPEWYLDDPILNPLTPWDRPPIKNVFCAYGIELKTEVGFSYSPSGRPYPDVWEREDTYYEHEGGDLRSSSGLPVHGNIFPASGDVTVPYFSLSWCKSWLGPRVNITRAPMHAHTLEDVQRQEDVAHVPGQAEGEGGQHLYPTQFGRAPGTQYITYYEDSATTPGHRTAVWELDKVDHRAIVSSHILLREIWLETLHEAHPNASLPFVRKDYREPMRDEDCFWDYTRASCAMTERCEYRYVFGDIHLGQSCRLRRGVDTEFFSKYM